MGATTGRDQSISEEMIDATLADSSRPAIRLPGHWAGIIAGKINRQVLQTPKRQTLIIEKVSLGNPTLIFRRNNAPVL